MQFGQAQCSLCMEVEVCISFITYCIIVILLHDILHVLNVLGPTRFESNG